jgi:hypothetical protein
MKDITQANLSDAVKSSFEPIDNPRMRLLVDRLVHHQHAYAQDTVRKHAEWREGIAFLHRNAWRPAYFHVIVEAPGYRSLITAVFDVEDPYVENAAVIGVRASQVAHFKTESDAEVARRYLLPASYLLVDLPIRLALVA